LEFLGQKRGFLLKRVDGALGSIKGVKIIALGRNETTNKALLEIDVITTNETTHETTKLEEEVLGRYARAAEKPEAMLCCPSSKYDATLLENLPREIVEVDYGCGDPSAFVNEGETVVDLGSGSGKACYILAQKVGPRGRVIGVDFNDAMLTLARKYRDEIAQRLGFGNVRFVKAKIQDLALDIERVEAWLANHPIDDLNGLASFETECDRLRSLAPAIADESVDAIVSDCVLNLVRPEDKKGLFREIQRVLRPGGRVVISDIVCDENPTPAMMDDPSLWSGCITGAFREDRFLGCFETCGLYGVEILSREQEPWQVIDGVEFRSMTVRAFKGSQGPCLERNQAAIYKGPWKSVTDDDGHTLRRGQRMAVCDKTFRLLTNDSGPYAQDVIGIPPLEEVAIDDAQPFTCQGAAIRDPRQSKGQRFREARLSDEPPCCSDEGGC